jgi:hypothetical protein
MHTDLRIRPEYDSLKYFIDQRNRRMVKLVVILTGAGFW